MKKRYVLISKKASHGIILSVCLLVFISALAIVFPLFSRSASSVDVESGIMPYSIEYFGTDTMTEIEDKEVYLTFDDGPAKYTPEILDILDKYEVSATFFVVGDTGYTNYIPEIVKRGHAIGLHSYNHNFEQIYRSTDAYFADLKKIDDIVYEETGVRSKVMRFPGGSSVKRGTTRSRMKLLCGLVQEQGYQYFDWNCESGDAAGVSTVSGALSRIKVTAKTCGNVIVVLMHDTEKVTLNALPGIIEYFIEQNCRFKVLTFTSPAVHHSW